MHRVRKIHKYVVSSVGSFIRAASFLLSFVRFAGGEFFVLADRRRQNIMLKKALDICVGGLSFAVFGYGLGFGVAPEGISTAAGTVTQRILAVFLARC